MNKISERKFLSLLNSVEKPGRYIGKEKNSCTKTEDIPVRFAFAFPDIYEIGMSHLGLQILYGLINSLPYAWCERVFAPGSDMEELMRKDEISLFSLESKTPVKDFDFLGFTLQYELSYTNILNMLELGKIEFYSKDRTEDDPIIIVGGPCAYNLEPIADFIDVAQIGEGEEIMVEFLALYKECKEKHYTKEEFLLEASRKIEGIYVPRFYDVSYNNDGTVKEIKPNKEGIPEKIKKRIIKNMDEVFFPYNLIVPNIEIVHNRMMMEIFRGCTRGCRFCQAGMLYRPIREKKKSTIMKESEQIYKATGYEELSLTSLSSSDYGPIEELIDDLNEIYSKEYTSISLPSLRLDNFSLEMAQKVQKVKKSGITFAPEAGSQKMRDIINKGVTKDDFINTLTSVFENGWKKLKLYFMIGLPWEEESDLEAIAKLGYEALDIYRKANNNKLGGRMQVTLSASCFVPKPFTPFQWFPQDSLETMKNKQYFIKNKVNHKNLKFNYHDPYGSRLEAVFARGDRRISKVILNAFKKGCKFDGWQEYFDYDKWVSAFEEENVSMDFYATRKRSYEELFPWDHIDCGVTKDYLIRENEKSKEAAITKDCRKYCNNCGINVEIAKGLCG